MRDDQLQREIEEALAVEPSPQFVARVRHHLVHERRSPWLQWNVLGPGLASAVVVAVVVAGILLYAPSQPSFVTPVVPEAAAVEAPPGIPVAQIPSRSGSPRKATIGKTPKEPQGLDVLIDPREAAAFRSFVEDVQQRRINPERLRELFDTAEKSRDTEGIQVAPIAGLEPIEIPPLIPVTPDKEGGSL